MEKGHASYDLGESFPPPVDFAARARVKSQEAYQVLCEAARKDPDSFWLARALAELDWITPPSVGSWSDFRAGTISWFADGVLNACFNCLDRHVDDGRGSNTALIWEGDDPGLTRSINYQDLLDEVCAFANVLKKHGIHKGDRVCIYLPMIPELAVAMLACARIGAVHSIVFGGFSAESLANRILDCDARVLITANQGVRGGKLIPLKETADAALQKTPSIETVFVVRRTEQEAPMQAGRDLWWQAELEAPGMRSFCDPEPMGAEDPLFILYTSGSTGKPKGVVHTTGGYLLYCAYTHKLVFDWRPEDVYWCTADIGWITGHSYIIYGPLCNGAQSLMFEGVPTYPDAGRFWDVVDKHQVSLFYTAPTAIRTLQQFGDAPVRARQRQSLRLLGTVGEPINPEAWLWYHRVVGAGRCPIVDTWWQTETGGILISPLPGATVLRPGSATFPLPGIQADLVDEEGQLIQGQGVAGNLVISAPWPAMARTIHGDHARFQEIYFSRYPGLYFTGDGAFRDKQGYYWITGRVDDVLNISGHRIGTAEVESALVTHPLVTEAAVVGMPHPIKGQGIYAFVTLMEGTPHDEELGQELIQTVRQEIGPIARPDVIQFTQSLPKTRSGKIMRRILRKIAAGHTEELGDTSTLADPSVVQMLVAGRPNP